MTRYRYYTAATLDGFIADENDSLEWLFVQEQDPDSPHGQYDAFMTGIGAMVMGATTYVWLRDHLTDDRWHLGVHDPVLRVHPSHP